MFSIKGFIEITSFANNNPAELSELGELSNSSLTFSKEKGYYSHPESPNVELITFSSKKDNVKVPTDAKYTEPVTTWAQWIFDKSILGSLNSNSEDFKTLFLDEFGSSVANFICGEMISHNGNWMPTFISLELDIIEDNAIHIWFADSAFAGQYDEYEIVVIPPYAVLDEFQKTKEYVQVVVDEFNVPAHHANVMRLTGGEPYTLLSSENYAWFDREDPTATLMTTWTVAVYGIAGNNIAAIKDALSDYILSNSGHSIDDWTPVFPDIFTSTEFIFIPQWHLKSIPDQTPRGEIYSPILNVAGLIPQVQSLIDYGVGSTHIEDYLEVVQTTYKSLTTLCIGGPENRDDVFRLSEVFPDYAIIRNTTIDFNRISAKTIAWILKFQAAIVAAEEIDEYSYVGLELSKVDRDGLLYVGFYIDKIQYLILTRTSLLASELLETEVEVLPDAV